MTGEMLGTFCAATSKLKAYLLNKWMALADGTGVYPASVIQDSALAKILSKADPAVTTSYNNTTDSLEALSDAIVALPTDADVNTQVDTALSDIHLDHLIALDGATQKYPETAVADSIIAKMIAKGDPATPSTYDCTTDSLEALSDKLDAIDDYVDAEVAAIKAVTDLIIAPVTAAENTVTANWNTATGTSGEAGEDLVSFGTDATKRKVGCFKIDVSACLDGSALTIKLFEKINGTERKIYSQGFVVNTDPDGIRIITSEMVITDVMRCEVYSSTSESVAIGYEVA